tara:strand:+ start:390 stop:701 length:312 start_codon:yes stop_codon:yes gene_type:complete
MYRLNVASQGRHAFKVEVETEREMKKVLDLLVPAISHKVDLSVTHWPIQGRGADDLLDAVNEHPMAGGFRDRRSQPHGDRRNLGSSALDYFGNRRKGEDRRKS